MGSTTSGQSVRREMQKEAKTKAVKNVKEQAGNGNANSAGPIPSVAVASTPPIAQTPEEIPSSPSPPTIEMGPD